MNERIEVAALADQITAYLSGGGLFNPELANHTVVRDLLIDCRAALQWAASQQAAEGKPEKECCVNWAAGTSCFSDPKQNCPRLFPFPRPMETAPKDGTMLRLLVQYDEHSFDDSNGPCWVCGFNLADNTGIDKWQFPGWSWVHDYILEASDDGTPIGWLPMLDALDAPPATQGGADEQR